jgi:hypothetical protein
LKIVSCIKISIPDIELDTILNSLSNNNTNVKLGQKTLDSIIKILKLGNNIDQMIGISSEETELISIIRSFYDSRLK